MPGRERETKGGTPGVRKQRVRKLLKAQGIVGVRSNQEARKERYAHRAKKYEEAFENKGDKVHSWAAAGAVKRNERIGASVPERAAGARLRSGEAWAAPKTMTDNSSACVILSRVKL